MRVDHAWDVLDRGLGLLGRRLDLIEIVTVDAYDHCLTSTR